MAVRRASCQGRPMKICRLASPTEPAQPAHVAQPLLAVRLSVVYILLLLNFAASSEAQFPPAPGTGPGLPETVEAIENARVTTRILYITAHPDDESADVLTYLARASTPKSRSFLSRAAKAGKTI